MGRLSIKTKIQNNSVGMGEKRGSQINPVRNVLDLSLWIICGEAAEDVGKHVIFLDDTVGKALSSEKSLAAVNSLTWNVPKSTVGEGISE